MAKKQSSAGLFERVGYALGSSKLKMEHFDYVKSLKENINISEQKREQLDKEYPNGKPTYKVGVNEEEDIKKQVLSITDEIKALKLIKDGDIDPEGIPYDIRDIGDQIDSKNKQLTTLNANTEDKAAFVASIEGRGEPSKSASAAEIANYKAVNSENYGKDGLDQRLNTETLEWEWYDQTVGKHVPIAQFNAGSKYDPTLAKTFDVNLEEIDGIKNDKEVKGNPALWQSKYKPAMMRKMKTYLEENPTAARNVIFEDDDFTPILDDYLKTYYDEDVAEGVAVEDQYQGIGGIILPGGPESVDFETWKKSSRGDAAIDLLKKRDDGPWKTDSFLDSYSEMLDNYFKENFVPDEEEVIEEKGENIDDITFP